MCVGVKVVICCCMLRLRHMQVPSAPIPCHYTPHRGNFEPLLITWLSPDFAMVGEGPVRRCSLRCRTVLGPLELLCLNAGQQMSQHNLEFQL